jgi:hypothetical protein
MFSRTFFVRQFSRKTIQAQEPSMLKSIRETSPARIGRIHTWQVHCNEKQVKDQKTNTIKSGDGISHHNTPSQSTHHIHTFMLCNVRVCSLSLLSAQINELRNTIKKRVVKEHLFCISSKIRRYH